MNLKIFFTGVRKLVVFYSHRGNLLRSSANNFHLKINFIPLLYCLLVNKKGIGFDNDVPLKKVNGLAILYFE